MKKIVAGTAIAAVALFGTAACEVPEETATESTEETAAPEEETPVTLTATDAGTTTDYEGATYTVVEVTVENDSEDTVSVNPIDFSAELSDGQVVSDWSDSMFADLEDPLDAVDVAPGQHAEGQVAVSGDVDVKSVTWSETFGLGESITAEVK